MLIIIVWGSEWFCSYADIDQMCDSEPYSDISLPSASQMSSPSSDGSMFVSFSESYNSDHGSGNEDVRDAGYVIYDESSDEVDYLAV